MTTNSRSTSKSVINKKNHCTYFIVGQESSLLRVLPFLSTPTGRRVHPKLLSVGQRERPTIRRHPDDQLLLGRPQLGPQLGGVVHRQLLLPLAVAAGGVERRVVAGLALPLTVEVVGHHVDKVQVGGHGGDVVAALDVVWAHGDGGGQE